MFGLSLASQLFQGSAERTWNCVTQIANLLWFKFNHIRYPIMPRSRRRHHSRSRSRSRSASHDRDREIKRRKIDTFDSPGNKRSVSSNAEDSENDDKTVVEITEQSSQTPTKRTNQEPKTSETKSEVSQNQTPAVMETDEPKDDLAEKIEDLPTDNNDMSSLENEDSTRENDAYKSEISKDVDVVDLTEEMESKQNELKHKLENKLNVTPKKTMSPKQLQKRLDSEKRRLAKQKEKEEKEKEKEQQRLERNRLKQEKLKEKMEKEASKQKEKEQREEQKRKEKEEKELKRKEREEKEELRKKEKEQERIKKQQEIEERNREKQKLQEQKQKTAAAFVNFFKKKETNEEKRSETSSVFMPFEIKSDMKLPPKRRKSLDDDEKENLTKHLQEPQENPTLYLVELKSKKIGSCGKTWVYEDATDDVIIVEDTLGETICEDNSKAERLRAKFLYFHQNQRPPYYGTWRKKSKIITGRRPFEREKDLFDYDVDSDDDWEEEEQGESLENCSDEDKENETENDDYEVDNEFFVPHGHLSDDEVDDEEMSKLSPESQKQKLKLLKAEFDHDMQSKTLKVKPRSIGCIWYDKDGKNVEESIHRYLQPLAIIVNCQVMIPKRGTLVESSAKKSKIKQTGTKEIPKELIPAFLKLLHGSREKKKALAEEFLTYIVNGNHSCDVTKFDIVKQIKHFAEWKKCTEAPMKNKCCWVVSEDVMKSFDTTVSLPNNWEAFKNGTA